MASTKGNVKATVNSVRLKRTKDAGEAGGKKTKILKTRAPRTSTDNGDQHYHKTLLNVLMEVKNGNFSARMPNDQDGLQGKLTERIPLPNGKGSWHNGVDSLNTLISDLVHPTIEIAHVIGSVAKGNLSEEMPMEIGGYALKYSKREEDPVIQIRSEEVMAVEENMHDGQFTTYCRIYFEDNGIGFDQQYADQVFGMFKRLHQSSEYEGTGIGLSICKNIAEEHNGSISVTSMVGQGSTFTVLLPAKQTELTL